VFLGGDHSITRWTVEPLAENSLGLLVLDAHYDMRSVEEGLTSGSWLWDLWVAHKGRVKAVIVGVGDFNNPEYLAMRAREAGFKVVPRLKLLESLQYALEAVDWLSEQGLENFYINIDVDHLDISHAPGVNSPTPLGMTPWESIRILEYAARKLKPRGVDVVEVTPQHDVAEVTVATAAKLLLYTIHNTMLNTT
jgi:agmatinase